jgi:hypothetical protein
MLDRGWRIEFVVRRPTGSPSTTPGARPGRASRTFYDLYGELLAECEITTQRYNLLIARRWMLLVPRRRERFETPSVNAVGFAGSLFTRTDERPARRGRGPRVSPSGATMRS